MAYLLEILGIIGGLAFAISGALAAMRNDMDIFGVCLIALMPAVGGGTLRDLILDTPVFWVVDNTAIWLALGAGILVFFASPIIESRRTVLAWADAIGLAVFSVLGAERAFQLTGSPIIAIMMGVTTGIVGGMIRDVICNEVPLVLKREVYATAGFVGAGFYILLLKLETAPVVAIWGGIILCFIVRSVAMIKGISLPIAKR